MPKLNICAARRPGMTHAQYSRYLRDDHARLVLGTEAVARYLQAYVQQHVYDGCYGPEAPAWRYDSVSHIHAATLADQQAASSTREYKEIIAPDEGHFADQRSPLFLMFDESPLPLPCSGASTLRLLHYLRARSAEAAAGLRAAWAAAHQALLDEEPVLFEGVRRATLNISLSPPDAEPPPYAGMCELGFLQPKDEPAMAEYVARIERRLGPLIQRDAGFYLLAETVPVRGTLY
ncbi:EthD domain-containing protein [Variovorax sp. LjRoot290]|uniref:EthD domain-containing protein n=1 Tax=unclassified Variovorax TaxID=663243 RepID=UPI003ECD9890